MSFLEPFAHQPAVILDIGHAYTKCGFSGESAPLSIIPTRLVTKQRNIYDYNDLETLREMLIEFLYRIYYKILNVNSKERKVVIIESILTPSEFRKTLAEVLFTNFQATSVLFMPSHVSSLYTLGITRALVLDCGYSDSQIVPIADGMPLTGLIDFMSLGAKRLHSEIETLVKKHAFVSVGNKKILFSEVKPEPVLTESDLEDIKLRCCFVTSFERSRRIDTDPEFKHAPECSYNLKNNVILHIPGEARETALEILFTNKLDPEHTIQSLVLDTLAKCPIDLKKEFASNVVLIGGTCMLAGFKDRLVAEINNMLSDETLGYANMLSFKGLKYHKPPSHENYTAWLGGSVFGSMEVLDFYSMQNLRFKETQKLPDWFVINPKNDMVQI